MTEFARNDASIIAIVTSIQNWIINDNWIEWSWCKHGPNGLLMIYATFNWHFPHVWTTLTGGIISVTLNTKERGEKRSLNSVWAVSCQMISLGSWTYCTRPQRNLAETSPKPHWNLFGVSLSATASAATAAAAAAALLHYSNSNNR